MKRTLATMPRPFPETAVVIRDMPQPAPLVLTSPSAVRSRKESRQAAQAIADKHPPVVAEALSPTQDAILLALPSSVGVPMDALAVAFALKSGEPAIELTQEACALELIALHDLGLVSADTRPFEEVETMRWTRSAAGDALDVVTAKYPLTGEES